MRGGAEAPTSRVVQVGGGGTAGGRAGCDPVPRLGVILAILMALAIVPLWSSRYLPMVDVPHHLAHVNILHHLDDGELPFGRFFTTRAGFTPYLGYYWTLNLLAYAIPLEWANRLFLSLYVAALPVSTAALAAALGRSPWLGLFALPLAFTFEFHMGFVGHLASLAMMMGSLALYASRLQGRRAGRGWSALAALLPLACLVTHVQPYAFFLAGLAVMIVLFPGRRAGALLAAAPSAVLFLSWLLPIAAGRAGGPSLTSGIGWEPFAGRLAALWGDLFTQFSDPIDSVLLAAFAVMWAWAMVSSLRSQPSSFVLGERWTPIVLAGGAIAGYLTMPTHAALMQFIHHRYATMAALLLAVAVPLTRRGAGRAWCAALVVLCAAHAIYLTVQFRRFDAEVGDFAALAANVERGSCVAQIDPYPPAGVMRNPAIYSGFNSYISLWRGAVPGTTFASTRHSPLALRARDGTTAASLRDAALPEVRAQEVHVRRGTLYATYGGFYRYFLTPRRRDVKELFGAAAGKLEKVGEAGPLALYSNPEGRCGQ